MKNNHARRAALALLLALMLPLLGGCAAQIEEREMADLSADEIAADVPAPQTDGAKDTQIEAVLYCLSEDGEQLKPVLRTVTVKGGESRAEAVLAALLGGPLDGEAYWPELGTAKSERLLEVSGGVATVDLPAHARTLPQETLYAVRMAIANTLTGFSEITYVNVLVGGREEGLDLGATLPVGTLTRQEDLRSAQQYSRLNEQRLSESGVTLLATLYFPDRDGRMILPEVRSIAFAQVSPIEYLYTLLEELGKGAADHALAAAEIPAPLDYIEEMPEIVRTEDGYAAIEIRLNSAIDGALAACGLTRGVYLAMLTDTLMGFVPGVDGLQVYIGSQQAAGLSAQETPDGEARAFALATRDDFAGYVGAPAVLYAQDENSADDGLVRVQHVLPQAQADDLRERLTALMQLSGEDLFALPQGLAPQDVLAVYEGEETIAVNLSGAFADALSKLTAQQERAAVYAMVNTLTEGRAASRVAFFFEGEQVQTLAGGLEMRGAFVRNPGMVVD